MRSTPRPSHPGLRDVTVLCFNGYITRFPVNILKSKTCYIHPTSLVCPDLAISIIDHTKETNVHCGLLLSYVRILVESKVDLETRNLNQNERQGHLVDEDHFSTVYKQMLDTVEQPGFVKIIQIADCVFTPTNLTIS